MKNEKTEKSINSIFIKAPFEEDPGKIYICHFNGNITEFDYGLNKSKTYESLSQQG